MILDTTGAEAGRAASSAQMPGIGRLDMLQHAESATAADSAAARPSVFTLARQALDAPFRRASAMQWNIAVREG